jgi:hypothetical protein
VGKRSIDQAPGIGSPERTPPSELFWKVQFPLADVSAFLENSLGESSATATTTAAGRPRMSKEALAWGCIWPLALKSMPWWRKRLRTPVVRSR